VIAVLVEEGTCGVADPGVHTPAFGGCRPLLRGKCFC
jgi:hypothetical protein